MMAFVLLVIAALIFPGQIFCVFRHTSTKTGFAPMFTILVAEARYVRDVTITSSPESIFRAFKAKSRASAFMSWLLTRPESKICIVGHGRT